MFALTLLIVSGIGAIAKPVLNEGSALHLVTGLVGTIISAGFLLGIAALNIVVLARHLGRIPQDACRALRRGRA